MDEQKNNNLNDYTYNGLLDKLQTMKELNGSNTAIQKNVVLIKTTNDSEIQNLVNLIMQNPKNSPVIGLRKVLRFLQKDKIVKKVELFEYNYLLSKKFPYLKYEAINNSDIILFILNIFDKRCLDNLKKIVEELFVKEGNAKNKTFKFLLIKSTDNFLLKLTETTALINFKKEIKNTLNNLISNIIYIEIEIDELKETDSLLNEIIKN